MFWANWSLFSMFIILFLWGGEEGRRKNDPYALGFGALVMSKIAIKPMHSVEKYSFKLRNMYKHWISTLLLSVQFWNFNTLYRLMLFISIPVSFPDTLINV